MIELLKVNKIYHTKIEDITALKDVSIKFYVNQLTFIVGNSGSGKSTLLNCIAGLDIIDSGKIICNGVEIKDNPNFFKNIGLIFQEHHLIESLSVYDNLRLVLSHDDSFLIKSVLEEVELSDFENKLVNTLSGGEKQRVSIARALLKNSNILLCDEPTGSLDQYNTDNIFNIIKKLSKKMLVIVVSHDEKSADKYADRILKMQDGEIVEEIQHKNLDSNECVLPIHTLKKPQIPFKILKKISFKYLFCRPVITTLLTILCLFSFIFVGLSYSLENVDSDKKIVQSMMDNQISNFSFQKKIECKINNDNQTYIINLNSDDISEISALTSKNVYNVYGFKENFITNFGTIKGSDLYLNQISGYTEINNSFVNDFQLEFFGKLPQTNDEVVITKYLFSAFKTRGMIYENQIYFPSSISDVIGKYIEIDNISFKICGVLNTNFNFSRYSILEKNAQNFNNLFYELKECLELGLHNLVYFKDGYHKNKMYYYNEEGLDNNTYDLDFLLYDSNNALINSNKYISSNTLPDEYRVICMEGKNPYNLSHNEILYPLSLKSRKDIYYFMDLGVEKFSEEHYDQIKDQFSNDNPTNHTINDYIDYIIFNGYKDEKYSLVYPEELFYLGVEQSLNIDPNLFDYEDISNYKIIHNLSSKLFIEKKVEIVGLYFNYDDYNNSTLFCSNDFLLEFKQNTSNYYNDIIYCVCPLDESINSNINIYKKMNAISYETKNYFYNELEIESYRYSYSTTNESIYSYINSIDSISILITICNYLSVIMIIIFIIYAFYHMSLIINCKENDIGIYRVLGYSKFDIFKLFHLSAITLYFLITILGNAIIYLLIEVINKYQKINSMILFSTFEYSYESFIMCFFIGLISCTMSVLLPLLIKYKKTPLYSLNKIDK